MGKDKKPIANDNVTISKSELAKLIDATKGFDDGMLKADKSVSKVRRNLINSNEELLSMISNNSKIGTSMSDQLKIAMKIAKTPGWASKEKVEMADKEVNKALNLLKHSESINDNARELLKIKKEDKDGKFSDILDNNMMKELSYYSQLKTTNRAEAAFANRRISYINDTIKSRKKDLDMIDAMSEKMEREVEIENERINAIKNQIKEESILTKSLEGIKSGWDKFNVMRKDPKLAWGAALSTSAEKLVESASSANSMRKELGLSFNETAKLGGVLTSAGFQGAMMGVSMEETKAAAEGLYDVMKSNEAVNSDNVKQVALMSERFGTSGQQSAELYHMLLLANHESTGAAKNMLEFGTALANARNVPIGIVMKDIAQNSALVAKYTKEGGKNMMEASVTANQMKIGLAEAGSMADGLLDVESSIQAEQEAAMMLGKDINLNKARELAMAGDMDGMLKEQARVAATLGSFESMNVMQREAAAKALGTNVEGLQKMMLAQEELNKKREVETHWYAGLYEYGQRAVTFMSEYGAQAASALNAVGSIATSVKALGGSGMITKIGGGIGKFGKSVGSKIGGLFGKGKGFGAAASTTTEISGNTGGATEEGGKGTKGFLEGLGNGLASMGKQMGDIIKGSLALGIAGVVIAGGLARALYIIKDVDPVQMLAFSASVAALGLTVAVMGKVGKNIIQGALAMGILGVALIPAAAAFSLLGGVDTKSMIAFSYALPLLTLAATGLGLLMMAGGEVGLLAGAAAFAVLGASLMPLASAFSLIGPATDSISSLVGLSTGMLTAGAGLISMGAGMVALAAGAALLTPFLPVLSTVAGIVGGGNTQSDNKMSTSKDSGGTGEIVKAIQELGDIIKSKNYNLSLDNRKLNTALGIMKSETKANDSHN